jgi:hypothetical protein
LPKLQIGFLYVGSFGLGLVPYALLIKSTPVWLVLLAIIAMVFAGVNRSRNDYSGEPPSLLEIAFGMLGWCAAGGTMGLFGVVIFYAVSGLRSLFTAGADTGLDPWAVYGSAGFVGLFAGAYASNDSREIINFLYPNRPGQRSPFFPLSTQTSARQTLGVRILVIAGAAAAVWIIGSFEALSSYFVLTVLLAGVAMVGAGADYLDAKTLDSAHGTPESAISAVKTLLETAGYRMIPRPRTGDEETDSVISILDFVAVRSDHAMAGRVRSGAEIGNSDVRYEAAALEPAVWVLQDQLKQQQDINIHLTPVLLLLGDDANRSGDNSPTASKVGRSARIIRAPAADRLAAMIGATDKTQLQSTANQLFSPASVSAWGAS